MKAQYVKNNYDDWNGDAKVFKMSPFYEGEEFVVISAIPGVRHKPNRPETFIFACNSDGEVNDFAGLRGSMRGVNSISEVLENIGYSEE